MIKRLRIKFVCINMVIVTVMLVFMMGLTLNLTKNSLEEESLQLMHETAKHDKHEEHEEKKSQKPGDKPAEEKPQEKKEPRLPTFTLRYDARGTLIATGNDTYDLSDTAYLQKILGQAMEQQSESGELVSQGLRFVRVEGPEGVSYVFTDISGEQMTLFHLLRDWLLIAVIAFVAFLGISIFLSFWAIKPVEKAWTQQRQFVGDASHELKTPLTVIMTNAELLREGSMEEDKREICVENISRMSLQMRSLIEELLTLARADDVKDIGRQMLNFSELAEDAVMQYEALFYEKGLMLQTEIDKGLALCGDETMLRRLAELLLDNVQKHSLPGEVQLSLKKQGKTAHLRISNPAEEISQEGLAHIFERFYRIDKARTDTSSHGLGLSIADGIVRRHGGSICAQYEDGRLEFHAKLPLK